jgi:hypothetical protein
MNAAVKRKLQKLLSDIFMDRLTVYHGAPTDAASKILLAGKFLPSNAIEQMKLAYADVGIPWSQRRRLPDWARKIAESEGRSRLVGGLDPGEGYVSASHSPKVAARWATMGGEIRGQVRYDLQRVLAAIKSGVKTEPEFYAWWKQNHMPYPRQPGAVLSAKATQENDWAKVRLAPMVRMWLNDLPRSSSRLAQLSYQQFLEAYTGPTFTPEQLTRIRMYRDVVPPTVTWPVRPNGPF